MISFDGFGHFRIRMKTGTSCPNTSNESSHCGSVQSRPIFSIIECAVSGALHHWWPMYSVSWPWYLRRLDPIPSPRPALIFMAHAGRKFVSVHESVESVLTLNTYFRFRFRPKILSFTFRFRAESESSFSAPFSFLAENVKPVYENTE